MRALIGGLRPSFFALLLIVAVLIFEQSREAR